MKLNRTTFFAYVRNAPFGGRLSTAQVKGMEAVLDHWATTSLIDIRWLAYILATIFHETAATMQPVRETLASSDQQAINRLEAAFKAGKLKSVKTPYWRKDTDGLSWFGRGLVQLTHRVNYIRMARILGIPLDKQPSLALELLTSILIIFEGMTRGKSMKGDFTGKGLEDYFNDAVDDPIGARRIINGTDKAKLIAGHYKNFLDALNEGVKTYKDDGRKTDYIAPDVKPEDAKPDDVPVAQSKSLWTILATIFGGGGVGVVKELMTGGSTFFGAISNPYTLTAFLAVLAGGGVLVWLIATDRITINRGKAPIA